MSFQGLRLITNLHCNQSCTFCYQKNKEAKVLGIGEALSALTQYERNAFKYATIMGGESTLLPDLDRYIGLACFYAPQVRLTTNGQLVDLPKCKLWKYCGLEGINVSIPVLTDDYSKITGSSLRISDIMNVLRMAKDVFGASNVRVNIPLCKENMGSEEALDELKEMFYTFLHVLNVKVTLCEDVLGTYSVWKLLPELELKIKKDTHEGLVLMDFHGQELGCYSHKDNYNNTDLIVSPVGVYSSWDGFCEAIGMPYGPFHLKQAIDAARRR